VERAARAALDGVTAAVHFELAVDVSEVGLDVFSDTYSSLAISVIVRDSSA
jgi:hypothetical protein